MPAFVTFQAHYERTSAGWRATASDDGVAVVTVVCRTLAKARADLVSELARSTGAYGGSIAVDDDVALPKKAASALRGARRARELALKATAQANRATANAASELVGAGLSLRDAAYLLGLSHARVQQLTGVSASDAAGSDEEK
ncbi:MAG TPA: hypothetical protein VF230_01535 [Acidimicrobiales bacterium]